MFARCILLAGQGPRSGANRGAALGQGRVVKERIRIWRSEEVVELWEEAVELSRVRPRRGRRRQQREEATQEEKNADRAGTLVQDGQNLRACQTLTQLAWPQSPRPTGPPCRRSTQQQTPPLSLPQPRMPPSSNNPWRRWRRL